MRMFAETPWALRQTFGFLTQRGHVVSLVGGGGKTTLMYFMADACARRGKKVLLSTTTHIYMPNKDYYARSAAEAETLWANGKFAVIGTPEPGTGKLSAPEEDFLRRMLEQVDITFLEADGSKHHPCKVPRAGEPVLRPESDLVIGVFGLSAIGKPLKEVCFRMEEAKVLLGVEEDHILTEEDAAEILSSPLGTRKDVGARGYAVVLNQCDDGPRRRAAGEIAARLALQGVEQVAMTAFDGPERDQYYKMARGEIQDEP